MVGRFHLGMDLMRLENGGDEALFKAFWHHGDAIVCCAWKVAGGRDVEFPLGDLGTRFAVRDRSLF